MLQNIAMYVANGFELRNNMLHHDYRDNQLTKYTVK